MSHRGLDAGLSAHRASPAGSARMLRDLTMLKKLVDDVGPAAEAGDDAPKEEIAAAAEAAFDLIRQS